MIRVFLLCMSVVMLSSCLGMGTQTPAPYIHYGEREGLGSSGVHTVTYGDTLWSVSNNYKVPMRDIAVYNGMRAPFILTTGQRIKLPPPQEYRVREGDSLYKVARIFDVPQSDIARLNDLSAPYRIYSGDVLKLPSVTEKTTFSAEAIAAAPSETLQKTALVKPKPKPKTEQAKTQVKKLKKSKITTKTPPRAGTKFLKPVKGKIISSYGPKKGGLHNDGINIAAPRGTPVTAAENGVVVYAGSELKGYGNLILVRHQDRWMTAYAHLDKMTINRGDVITKGKQLGTVGSTGSVSTPQLHFEIRRGKEAINPKRYLN
jgi:murein DD-endopeptidase MepM/ murein hydrolase activator NlpD